MEANRWADCVEACYRQDSLWCRAYNREVAGGKWNHMMDQVHIGYESWHAPRHNRMPQVERVDSGACGSKPCGGYVFRQKNGVVAMEAEHAFGCRPADGTEWVVLEGLGRTRSGLLLMPYTRDAGGAALEYRMELHMEADSVDVYLTFGAVMPFLGGGHHVAVSLDGGAEQVVCLNQDLTWENKYTLMYPTGAARVIEKKVRLPLGTASAGCHSLVCRPLQPGIVWERITVDCGGYEPSHLGMPESPYRRAAWGK